MTFVAPYAYEPSWLPVLEAITTWPPSVTAWTLQSTHSCAAPNLCFSDFSRLSFISWFRTELNSIEPFTRVSIHSSFNVMEVMVMTSAFLGKIFKSFSRASFHELTKIDSMPFFCKFSMVFFTELSFASFQNVSLASIKVALKCKLSILSPLL